MASEIGSIQPNPYIFNIENRRKRKARLAHEIGAGARCRKCEDKCPGFQLHFWRKVCQNCRCGKDDHEVEDDDEDIGKIVIGKLFERPIRTKEEEQLYSYGTDLEMINDSTGQKEKLKFDWIPPGVERAIAKRYMEMLPPEKRPVAGSEAAKERRRQLEQQVPLYDMDESERCETLPPAELQNFQRYLEVLRTRVAGQGSVQEIVPLMGKQRPPAQLFQGLDNLPPPPESWINSETSLDTDNSSSDPRSHHSYENLANNNFTDKMAGPKSAFINDLLKIGEQQRGPAQITDALGGLSVTNKNMSNQSPLDASPHFRQPSPLRSQYTPVQSEFAAPGQGDPRLVDQSRRPDEALLPSGNRLLPSGSAPLPPSGNANASPSKSSVVQLTSPKPFMAKSEQQHIKPGQFSSRLPDGPKPFVNRGHNNADSAPLHAGERLQHYPSPTDPQDSRHGGDLNKNEMSPYKGSSLLQMTPRDGAVFSSSAAQAPYVAHKDTLPGYGGCNVYGSDVTVLLPQESQLLSRHDAAVPNSGDLAQSFACQYCKLSMKPGDVAVICERAGPGKYWHPKCFVCVTCQELLADLIYFYKDGQVFCGRHYTQAADIPRCKACDELIFGESWTRADNCDWHIHHFCCFICDKPLAGSKYIPDNKDFPHCLSCFMSFKAKMCETCEDKITPQETCTGYNGYFFHALPQCFSCYRCKTSLMGKKFKMVKNWVFCSQDCVIASEAEIAMNLHPKVKA